MFKRTLFFLFFVTAGYTKEAYGAMRALEREIRLVTRDVADRTNNLERLKENLGLKEIERQKTWISWDQRYSQELQKKRDILVASPTTFTPEDSDSYDEWGDTSVKPFRHTIRVRTQKYQRRDKEAPEHIALQRKMVEIQRDCLYDLVGVSKNAVLPTKYAWTRSVLGSCEIRINETKIKQLQDKIARTAALGMFKQATAGAKQLFESDKELQSDPLLVNETLRLNHQSFNLTTLKLHEIDEEEPTSLPASSSSLAPTR